MLNDSIIQKTISKHLSPLFKKHDFKKNRHQNLQFRKNFDGGFQSCLFFISTYPEQEENPDGEEGSGTSNLTDNTNRPEFWIEFSLGVRIDIVERFANQFTLTLKDYYNETHTILTSYGRLTDQPYFRFKVADLQALENVCTTIADFLEGKGFALLNNYSSIHNLDKLLNDYPEKPSKFIYNQSIRCIKGIVIARICQNPHFNTLVKAYDFILNKHSLSQDMLPKYKVLVQHLYAFSAN